jgi:hypothetical protein
MDRAYTTLEDVLANRVVVHAAAAGSTRYPCCKNDDSILGVSTHSQSRGKSLSVRRFGFARVEALEEVRHGDPVMIADREGRVKAALCETGVIHCLGYAETDSDENGMVEIMISIHDCFRP